MQTEAHALQPFLIRHSLLLDANVLYRAPVRDIFVQLVENDIVRARWTRDIHREWIAALLRNAPHRDRKALERTRDLMDRAFPDCLVTGYEDLASTLTLPDPNDRHVLAAAIVGRCNTIVTSNLRDFPETVLEPYGIDARQPDDVLCDLLDTTPEALCKTFREIRTCLEKPAFTARKYLDNLARQGLIATAARLEQFAADI